MGEIPLQWRLIPCIFNGDGRKLSGTMFIYCMFQSVLLYFHPLCSSLYISLLSSYALPWVLLSFLSWRREVMDDSHAPYMSDDSIGRTRDRERYRESDAKGPKRKGDYVCDDEVRRVSVEWVFGCSETLPKSFVLEKFENLLNFLLNWVGYSDFVQQMG